MKFWGISAVLFLLVSLGCSTAPKPTATPGSFAIVLTQPLRLGGRDYRTISPADVPHLRQLIVADHALTLTGTNNTQVVRTVAEYDQLRNKGYFANSTAEILRAAPFAIASSVLKAVAQAKQVETSFITQPRRGVQSLELLPIEVLPWHESDDEAEHKRRAAMNTSLAQLVKEGIVSVEVNKSEAPPTVTFRWPTKIFTMEHLIKEYGAESAAALSGSVLTLIELARGDFTGDGIEDILVYQIHRFTEGSFVAYDVYFLTRTAATGLFKIKSD